MRIHFHVSFTEVEQTLDEPDETAATQRAPADALGEEWFGPRCDFNEELYL